jgi:single-stranded DNA-specific DHH superfamily exonuclease
MTAELLKYLDLLEPTGYGNPGAVFVSRNVRVVNHRAVGADAKHLKLTVSDGKVTSMPSPSASATGPANCPNAST